MRGVYRDHNYEVMPVNFRDWLVHFRLKLMMFPFCNETKYI